MRTSWVGPIGWTCAVAAGIVLVAYTDWRVPPHMSVSYLYLAPLVLAGAVVRGWISQAAVVVACAGLREWLGPYEHTGPAVIRMTGVITTYATVVFAVSWIQARQRAWAELADEQGRQLAQDLQEAAALQRRLIPGVLPSTPGWELAARLYPARGPAVTPTPTPPSIRTRNLASYIQGVGRIRHESRALAAIGRGTTTRRNHVWPDLSPRGLPLLRGRDPAVAGDVRSRCPP